MVFFRNNPNSKAKKKIMLILGSDKLFLSIYPSTHNDRNAFLRMITWKLKLNLELEIRKEIWEDTFASHDRAIDQA